MLKNKIPVRFTGQHFTVDNALILDAINHARLDEYDTVLDIGAGKGFLTVHLAKRSRQVIAIEKDRRLVRLLRKRFSRTPHVRVVQADFRDYPIPEKPFKAISNIPYGITSDILKILMYHNEERFAGGSLVMQLEAARKLISEKIYNPYVVFYRTFFELTLMYEAAPESFMPPPTVRSALLKIEKIKGIDIGPELNDKYLDFLFFMLDAPGLPVRTALKKVFRKRQVRELAAKINLDPDRQAACLTAVQWSKCFVEMIEKVPGQFHPKR